MEAAIPPWASDRGWEGVGRASGAGFPVPPSHNAKFNAMPPPQKIMAKPKPSMAANPWEGALGPPVAEAQATSKVHARADVSKLIKTPKEVWKAVKKPTEFTTAPLPGGGQSACEKQLARRTPSHLRGNAKASRGVVASSERLPDTTTIRATKRVWKADDDTGIVTMMVRPKRTIIPASSMTTASFSALSALSEDAEELPERAQSAAAVLEDTEHLRSVRRPETEAEMQAIIRDLKAQFAKLQQTAGEKEVELERLHMARDRSDTAVVQAGEADRDMEEFKNRIEARYTAIDERLPDLAKQKHALGDVITRLNKANKVMNSRLQQCREELRVYNGELRDMNLLLKDVETARKDAQSQLEKMKVSAKEDAKKRMEDLARRQARVEKMLAETKDKAERLKEVQKREEEEHMARQAEEDLARKRAFDNGTSFGEELRKIRENVHGPEAAEDPFAPQAEESSKVAVAMKKILHAAHASDVNEALAFWNKAQDRRLSLENLARDLTSRVERLSTQADPSVGVGVVSGGDHEMGPQKKELEEAVRDIETFADQNMAVNEAMRGLLRNYISWVTPVYKTMVRVSDDDDFLRIALKIAKASLRIPSTSTNDEERLAAWCSDSLVTMQNAVTAKLDAIERAQRGGQGLDTAPRGPGTGPRITALSSNQTLLVSSRAGAKGSTQMERL